MSIIGEGLEILGLIDRAKNADVYRQLGDYIDKVRTQQIENDKLHEEVRNLKEQLRFKGTVERISGHTFVEGDDEGRARDLRVDEVARVGVLVRRHLDGEALVHGTVGEAVELAAANAVEKSGALDKVVP